MYLSLYLSFYLSLSLYLSSPDEPWYCPLSVDMQLADWYEIGRLAWDCVIGQGLTFDRYFGDVLSSAWIVHRHWVGFGSWDGLEFV